jgi:hypothetical protein
LKPIKQSNKTVPTSDQNKFKIKIKKSNPALQFQTEHEETSFCIHKPYGIFLLEIEVTKNILSM